MLIESTTIRTLLNHNVTTTLPPSPNHDLENTPTKEETHAEPPSYTVSTNPLPALVIFLLGIMMSSHTQDSMISSMVHKQWGQLLTGAAFARALTYALLWLRPPRSVLPSRPPTEVLAAFGLMGGGVVFMGSVSSSFLFFVSFLVWLCDMLGSGIAL
jgi:hypothetical protein